jgi:hypothetical protein
MGALPKEAFRTLAVTGLREAGGGKRKRSAKLKEGKRLS